MATFNLSWTIDNTIDTVNVKVKYRLAGAPIWSTKLVAASGTTATVTGLNNRIYDFQYQNINNDTNPLSALSQAIGFSEPVVFFSPTNISVGYQFANLSEDIDNYVATIATYDNPGVILATHTLTPADPVTDTFTGLTPLTKYAVTIKPTANQFFDTFNYTFTTEELASCAEVSSVTATLS